MRKSGFWRVLRRRVMPALVSVAAIAVTVAAVAVSADMLRDGKRADDADAASATAAVAAAERAAAAAERAEEAAAAIEAVADDLDRFDYASLADAEEADLEIDLDALGDFDGNALRFFIANLLANLDEDDIGGFLADLDIGPLGGDDGPVLGVQVAETPDGVVVRAVTPGGPADDAGVEPGAVIEAVDGRPVATVRALRDALDAIEPGDEYTLDVSMDSAAESLTARRAEPDAAGIAALIERLIEWLADRLG